MPEESTAGGVPSSAPASPAPESAAPAAEPKAFDIGSVGRNAPAEPQDSDPSKSADETSGEPKEPDASASDEPKPEAEKSSEESEKPADAEMPALDAELLYEAAALGLPKDDVMGCATNAELKRAMSLWAKAREGAPERKDNRPGQPQSKDDPLEKLALFDATKDIEPLLEKFEDDDAKAAMKTLAAQNNLLRDFVVNQQRASAENMANVMYEQYGDRLDGFFSSLGPEYEPLFGKGGIRDLAANSEAVQNRNALAKKLPLEQGGRFVLPTPKQLKEAFGAVFSDQIGAIARRNIEGTMQKRKASKPLVPGHVAPGKPAVPNLNAKAEQAAAEALAKHGYQPNVAPDRTLQFMPKK